ncbi:MAG: MFS transporter, partial [Candidatus Methanofastidiosia archaeon]
TLFASQPPVNALIADLTPAKLRGRVYGIFFFLTFGVGALAPSILGWIIDSFGLEKIFTAMLLMSGVALVFALRLYFEKVR